MLFCCPSCHMTYAWDGEQCHHCQVVSGIDALGTVAGTGSALVTLHNQIADTQGGSQLLDELGHVLGDNLGDFLNGMFSG